MSAAAITADADVDLLGRSNGIFDCKVPQLKAAWKQLDQSGFEPASNKHLRPELMKRLYYKAFNAEQVSTSPLEEDETPLPSPSDSASEASPPSSSKSYKEAVTAVPGNTNRSEHRTQGQAGTAEGHGEESICLFHLGSRPICWSKSSAASGVCMLLL